LSARRPMHATESSGWLSIHLLLRPMLARIFTCDCTPCIRLGANRQGRFSARLTASQRYPPFERETNQEIVMLSKTALRS